MDEYIFALVSTYSKLFLAHSFLLLFPTLSTELEFLKSLWGLGTEEE
jgi:hypothetical protein